MQEQEGCYIVRVEGKIIGYASTLSEASRLALAHTKTGERFDIHMGPRYLGMFVRTREGQVAVPKGQEETVSRIPAEKMQDFVEQQYEKGKPFPWWIVLAAGGAAVVL